MPDVTIETLKDYSFIYEELNKRFVALPEERKIEFCRSVKDGWNSPIREIFEDVLRRFYEEIALRSKTIEELSAMRQAIVLYLMFKKDIEGKIALFQQKIGKDDIGSESLKNL